jgi:3-phosphoshikimate 1-carboxyvinyltransferase
VVERMGVPVERRIQEEMLGEPIGVLTIGVPDALVGTRVGPDELPLVIDEVPILAVLGAFATGETSFLGASELRTKESDRLARLAGGLRALGGTAEDEGEDLVVGGGGLAGGRADAATDHRLAMAFAVAALGTGRPSDIDGMESAAVSFPGFLETLRQHGASVEVLD